MKDFRLYTEAEWAQLVDEAAVLCDRLVDMLPLSAVEWIKWNRITDAAHMRLYRRELALWAKQESRP
jgi:hypothetical protein